MGNFDRKTAGAGPQTFGVDGETVTYTGGSYVVPDTVKAIVVVAAGDVVCRPKDASADITITEAPVGFVLPWHCLHITEAGTDATLATVKG